MDERPHDVLLADELQQGVVAEEGRAEPTGQVPRQRRVEVRSEHIGEPQDRDGHLGVVPGEVPHQGLGLDEGALERVGRRRRPGHRLAERVGVPRAGAVDEARGLDDQRAHRRPRRSRCRQQVQRPDHVHVLETGGGPERRIDHEPGVDDRVDVGGRDDAVEGRVGVVGDPDVVGPGEGDRRLGAADADDDLDLGVVLEGLGHAPAPEGVGARDQEAAGHLSRTTHCGAQRASRRRSLAGGPGSPRRPPSPWSANSGAGPVARRR